MLGAFTSELDRIAPKFEIQGSQIQILRTPTEFYETLKVGGIKVLEPMKMC
jgi:CDP-diacylglycerol--glycerol-3-phosphate 3-phosphatidyltransferase